jgi:hypothetical protein
VLRAAQAFAPSDQSASAAVSASSGSALRVAFTACANWACDRRQDVFVEAALDCKQLDARGPLERLRGSPEANEIGRGACAPSCARLGCESGVPRSRYAPSGGTRQADREVGLTWRAASGGRCRNLIRLCGDTASGFSRAPPLAPPRVVSRVRRCPRGRLPAEDRRARRAVERRARRSLSTPHKGRARLPLRKATATVARCPDGS